MARVKFNQTLTFGESSPVELVKAHQYTREWEKLPFEKFLGMKMEDFFGGQLRIVVECRIENKTCRIASHQEDFDAIRLKHPDDLCVYLRQIFLLWRHVTDIEEELPRVLIACNELGASVV